MMVNFPNGCRSYDAKAEIVRFWGYDSVIEVSFLLETGALRKLQPNATQDEPGYLKAFDATLDRIHEAARKAHARARKGIYTHHLAASDF